MFSRDLWSEIFHSIKSNKLRTFLTGFSVAWGIFILVLLLASVDGMKNGFTKQFGDDASNSIFISAWETTKAYGGFEKGRRIQLDNSDLDFIKKSFDGYYEYISPRYGKSVPISYKNETGTYSVRSISPDHWFIERTQIDKGRYINQNDIKNTLKVVVMGKVAAEELFKDEDPIGKDIILNGLSFKVIGIFSDDGNEREERNMYAPISTFQRLYGNTDHIDQITLTYNPDFNFAEAINFSNSLEKALKRRLVIAPDDQGAIYINNYAEGFSDLNNFTLVLSMISIGVGMLILIAGIVGIGNILVFIIKERTKEIGVRKALGAKPFDVIKLVLLESVFITSISGFIGMIFATSIVALISPILDTPAFANPSVDGVTVITSTIVLIVAGVLAGLIPAIKAARVKPIVALRAD
ncbi:ABC transporter permease [Galbibacter sp. EGI 63066]|uniref:ABC transporter permease n=1 Tax=Galbibacter sp. EGI 63066 TaxID=2993559 RepID=UPI002248DFAB|nr:ABC transporter permease [Galbibacter sp. EGI 63066]MCX2681788.1 ABC transporter permease [Galbibacter sp. EGI 63066]